MIFYCPNCWRELPSEQGLCVHCGQEVSVGHEKTFTEKLVQALSHPEPMTQMRAVYLLGEKRVGEVVGSLAQLFRRNKNPFLQTEIIEAIGKIGGDSAYSILIEALRHPSFIVRGEAAKALASFPAYDGVNQALERTLKDPSSYVRESGQEALERLQGSGVALRE